MPQEEVKRLCDLSAEQINLMLKALPIDVSFVDENDTVRYYSATPDRVFPRSPGVIDRKVQNCHPPKSLGAVQRILDDFKNGERNTAEFWIQMKGRFIHIRYYILRAEDGAYRGCLEASQDVTEIRELKGEKRLLDWRLVGSAIADHRYGIFGTYRSGRAGREIKNPLAGQCECSISRDIFCIRSVSGHEPPAP